MQKIIDYKIAYDEDIKGIVNEVNEYIKQGYQPWGSMSFQVDDEGHWYRQSMVKYEKGFDALGHSLTTRETLKKDLELDKDMAERLGL